MKLFALVVVIMVFGASEAIEPGALINLKAQFANFLVNKAGAALQAKQNLILSGTQAVLSAKQNLIQRQIPHLFAFKANKINSVFQLKKNLLSTTAAQLGQIVSSGGGQQQSSVGVPTGPYSPPAEPIPSSGPLPAAPAYSDGPSASAPEAQSASQEHSPPEPVQEISVTDPPSQTPCTTCTQSTSGPVQFPLHRPAANLQPAVRPQMIQRLPAIYAPPSRPQEIYAHPSSPPLPPPPPQQIISYGPPPPQQPISYRPPPPQIINSYGLPANHKPASTYGPPDHY